MFISDNNQSFDPLHYVLLFPDGSPGWCVELYQNDPKTGETLYQHYNGEFRPTKISPTQFYNYQLQTRNEKFHYNTIPRSGKLMQEYACMQFYKAERQRLNYKYIYIVTLLSRPAIPPTPPHHTNYCFYDSIAYP